MLAPTFVGILILRQGAVSYFVRQLFMNGRHYDGWRLGESIPVPATLLSDTFGTFRVVRPWSNNVHNERWFMSVVHVAAQ